MFITSQDDSSLIFIKSKYINAFPCSRRRSTLVASASGTVSDKYYIPFDPEARLNTEANNRKHSGLNGFKQSYLYDWNETTGKLCIVLAGYWFDIHLSDTLKTPSELGEYLESLFAAGNLTKIYAKIKMASTPFFSGGGGVPEARTSVLIHQTADAAIPNSLDMLYNEGDPQEIDSYYFAGLTLTHQQKTTESENIVYLPILEKSDNRWRICESSRLPNVEHGSATNSVKVGLLEADSVSISGNSAVSLVIGKNNGKPQLQFKIT